MRLGFPWTVVSSVFGNVVEIVSDRAHTGTNSVHMSLTTTEGTTFICESQGLLSSPLWGRAWMFIMNDPSSAGPDVYIDTSEGYLQSHGVRALSTQAGTMTIHVDSTTGAGTGETATSNQPLPRGAWTCFEWQIAATGATGSVTLYMNGAQLASLPNVELPTLNFQCVGYEHDVADHVAGDLWIDDFAIGTTRLGCM
jgi:hypothetical protein